MPQISLHTSARRDAFAGLAGLALAMGVGRFAFTPILPLMQHDAGVTISGGAWLAAANYFGYLVGAIAALGIRVRASTAIRAGLVATGAVTLAMGYTQSFPAWLTLRWTAGFASAFLFVFISAWALERVSGRPALRAGVYSGVGAGIFAVGIGCLALDRAGAGSSAAWIALGAATFVLTALLWPMFSGKDAGTPVAATGAVPTGARATGLIVSYGLFGYGYIIPATFLPVMGKAAAGSEWAMGLAWPAFGLAAFASTFLAVRIAAPGSTLKIWRLAQVMLAMAVTLPVISPALTIVILAGVIVGGTFMVITMAAMQTARDFAGAKAHRLIAAMTAAFAAGQLAGPVTVPLLVDAAGDFSHALLIAAAALAAGVFLLPLRKDRA